MLQQTRVETVIPYYRRFLHRFPTLERLAAAPERDVLAAWSGLGYYSRARNLHRAARAIAQAGAFPRDYEGIRALAGVGPYTAAAVASIAFGLPHAVLDGNVMRVIARITDDSGDIASAGTRRRFERLADQWLDRRDPGLFNQAIMELGATLCLPRAPRCAACPLARLCLARARGTAAQLPVKLRRAQPVRIEAELAVAARSGRVLLRQRGERPMAGFWELPAPDELPGFRREREHGAFRHSIVHRRYLFTVCSGSAPDRPAALRWFTRREIAALPLSTTARKALALAGWMTVQR